MPFSIRKRIALERRLFRATSIPEPASQQDPRTVTMIPSGPMLYVADTATEESYLVRGRDCSDNLRTWTHKSGSKTQRQLQGLESEGMPLGQKVIIYHGDPNHTVTVTFDTSFRVFTVEFGDGFPIILRSEPTVHQFVGSEVKVEVAKREYRSCVVTLSQ